jgi:hypothetical protein
MITAVDVVSEPSALIVTVTGGARGLPQPMQNLDPIGLGEEHEVHFGLTIGVVSDCRRPLGSPRRSASRPCRREQTSTVPTTSYFSPHWRAHYCGDDSDATYRDVKACLGPGSRGWLNSLNWT